MSYNRRFRDLMNEAYPIQVNEQGQEVPRNRDQMEILIKIYAQGLRDRALARKIITPDWPETVQQAMERTALNEKAGDNLERLGYRDEPMEVDVVAQATPSPSNRPHQNYSQTEKELYALKKQYGKLERKIDEVLKKGPSTPTSTHAPSGQRDQRKCFFCGIQGHIQRDCRKFRRWQSQQADKKASPAKAAEVSQQ